MLEILHLAYSKGTGKYIYIYYRDILGSLENYSKETKVLTCAYIVY